MTSNSKRSYHTFFIFNLIILIALVPAAALFAETSATPPRQALDQAVAVQDAFRYVADKVQPAVVEINIVEKGASPKDSPPIPWRFNSPDGGSDQQPQPQAQRALGSGIIVRQDGKTVYVLTNNHVAGSASEITVTTSDEKEHKATLVGKDERKDIALVRFQSDSQAYAVAELGDSSAVRVGDWAIAIGSPLGLVSSVTAGIVSAVHRSGGPEGNINDFIQTDASINSGNSGGALVNIRGEVVGMNTWIASSSGGSIGLGFAIPINNIKKAIGDFIKTGKVEYGWMGIGLDALDSATSSELGADSKNPVIAASVFRRSPAEKAGIQPGDVLLSLNGEPTKGAEQIQRIVSDLPPGKAVPIEVLRSGKKQSLSVLIEVRDDGVASNESSYFPGLIVRSLKFEAIDQSKLPKGIRGVMVANVSDKSPAAIAGVQAQDIITAINGKGIASAKDFYASINDPGVKSIAFTITRGDEKLTTPAFAKN